MALRLPCPIRGHWCIWAAPVRGTLEASKAPLSPRASGSPLSPGQPGSTNCNLASEAASPGSLNPPPPPVPPETRAAGGNQREGCGLRGAQTLLTRGTRTASRHTQNRYNHNHRPANKASSVTRPDASFSYKQMLGLGKSLLPLSSISREGKSPSRTT